MQYKIILLGRPKISLSELKMNINSFFKKDA